MGGAYSAFVFETSLLDYLNLNTILFFIAFIGILYNRRNLLIILLCLEICFFTISINFILFGYFLNNPLGYVYGLILIALAAVETAIGFSLLVRIYQITQKISFEILTSLRD